MKRISLFFLAGILATAMQAQSKYTVSGGGGVPLMAEQPRPNVEVWLLNGLTNSQISFTSATSAVHQWYKYHGTNAVPVASTQNGNTSTVYNLEDGYGYYVDLLPDTAVWIIDYSLYKPKFFGLETIDDYPCEYLNLTADVEAEPLYYETPYGAAPYTLQRTFTLTYNNLEWDDAAKSFNEKTETLNLTGNISSISLENKPLENTTFILIGDAFAEYFGIAANVSTEYSAVAVEAHATAETEREYGESELHETGDVLGGSAPVEYVFTAYANEPVASSYLWDVKKREANGTLTNIVHYPGNTTLKYNFETDGTFVVSLQVSNGQSSCVDTSQVFNVEIGETIVKIPNAFSPGSSVGVNDEFRIAYKSITSFKATIFNRWGNVLYTWTDPSKGWDGRVNGKFVPTGAYYVIVEYTDSKGKKHRESSDVNILRGK
jgi:gliding motility-associated-like protein